ncbi:MAG: hypothetical protein ACT4OH_03675 [Methylophilaceae bacterium]
MKDFLLQSAKFAVVLSLLGIVGFGIYKGVELTRQKFQYETILAIPKNWNQLTLHSLENVKTTLVTKWQDGILSYQFGLKGYPAAFTQANNSPCNSSSKFILTFLDKNGFKIYDQQIMFSELKQLVDTAGTPVGLSGKGSTYKPAGVYGKAVSWDVVWVP